jgi:NTE family protein
VARRWMDAVGAEDVHHVRQGTREAEDMARLGRLLAGAGVALVIGGGGARAFAAAGIARALAEARVPIDVLGGVSAGAVIAALLAAGHDYERLLALCRGAYRRTDYTLPVHALTTGRNWSETLRQLFGEARIEDLLLSFFCTSVNLSAVGLVVHETGSLLHAARATTAIPGILPPVWHEGDLLVDGGLMNNLPIDLARARPDVGHVLAISFSAARERQPIAEFGYHISGWRALGGRLLGARGTGVPSTTNLLMQSMLVADAVAARNVAGLADWIFRPPMQRISLMDWPRFAAIADWGYRYGTDVLRDEAARAKILVGPASEQP